MNSYLRRHLGLLDVFSTQTYALIRGIDKYAVLKDISNHWDTTIVGKYMFYASSSSEIKIPHYFLPDFLYMVRELLQDKRSIYPKRNYSALLEILVEKTWAGQAETTPVKSIINEKVLGTLAPWPLKDHQIAFIKHYGLVVPAYRLNGYMLEAGTGSGKTMTSIEWSQARGHDHMLVVCPPNVVDTVWTEHLTKIVKKPRKVWTSTSNKPLSLEYDDYIVHYNQLDKVVAFFKANVKAIGKVGLVLDESQHLNRMTADRTQNMVELAQLHVVADVLWMSATPFDAVGTECIPFLITADPYFTPEVEVRFRKIFGKSAKKANEILRARLGILKYYIPKQEAAQGDVPDYPVAVKLPHGEQYTMTAISKDLQDYVMERKTYYERNKEEYIKTYDQCIDLYVKKMPASEQREFNQYKLFIATIRKGYDPRMHKEMSVFCNRFERKNIIPLLPDGMKEKFRNAKSVVKYLHLKVLGEALGKLSMYRTKCNIDIALAADITPLIDSAKKKTLIFSSNVEVVDALYRRLKDEGYEPVVVYGETKDISAQLKRFNTDPDANPLITTYQSLSTGVPLIAANRTLYMNPPFRDRIKKQALGRTDRLGQDEAVDGFSFTLDTGNEPNISTRSQNIMDWSAEQVKSLLGTTNLDVMELSMETELEIGEEVSLESEEQESLEANTHAVGLPPFLYHGSKFKQDELMPGFLRTNKLVKWDVYESNKWLYVTSSKQEAILLGIGSSIEKSFELDRFSYDVDKKTMVIEASNHISNNDLFGLDVYVYTLAGNPADGWVKNNNANNSITTEWKTESVIHDSILKKEKIDVRSALVGWSIKFK